MVERGSAQPLPELSSKKKFCRHCNAFVLRRTFYRHREKIFNPISSVWSLSRDVDRVMDLNHDVNPREMMASEDDMEINSDEVNGRPNFNYELEDDDGASDGVTNCNFNNYDCHQDNASWERMKRPLMLQKV